MLIVAYGGGLQDSRIGYSAATSGSTGAAARRSARSSGCRANAI